MICFLNVRLILLNKPTKSCFFALITLRRFFALFMINYMNSLFNLNMQLFFDHYMVHSNCKKI
jgi:hypothetical protein